jgi:DNA-directed RNA polymerase subunit M/transcription elongation factor TFIIS
MRDNEERFIPPDDGGTAAAVQPQQSQQKSLDFAVPTEFVSLPSKGKFYPQNHPLHGKDTVEIKFMTAKEEDILTSKSLIKKGIAIDRMLQNLLVDHSVKVEDLLLGDKNALTIAARISGYGADYGITVTCPSCEEKCKHEFDLSLIEEKETTSLSELPVSQNEDGTFTANLLKTDATVIFRLLTGKDEIEIVKSLADKKIVREERNSTSQLKRIIVSVNGQTDKRVIEQFVDNLPVVDAKLLRNLSREVTPNVDMVQEFACPSCGHEEEVEIPFTVEFFWPK